MPKQSACQISHIYHSKFSFKERDLTGLVLVLRTLQPMYTFEHVECLQLKGPENRQRFRLFFGAQEFPPDERAGRRAARLTWQTGDPSRLAENEERQNVTGFHIRFMASQSSTLHCISIYWGTSTMTGVWNTNWQAPGDKYRIIKKNYDYENQVCFSKNLIAVFFPAHNPSYGIISRHTEKVCS